MPVNQLGTVTVPEATLLVISPWDPAWCADRQSHPNVDLGLKPHNDGKVGALPMPSPTEGAAKKSEALAQGAWQNHRTGCATSPRRQRTIDKLEKEKKISQDEQNGRWKRWKRFLTRRPRRSRICPRQRERNSGAA